MTVPADAAEREAAVTEFSTNRAYSSRIGLVCPGGMNQTHTG